MDSEKAAIKPKGILSASKPIHLVKVLPNRSQREVSESSFDHPW
jgi:hypothetical protein